MNEKEVQQKYLELQLINTQIKQLTQQLNLSEQQLFELMVSIDSLEDLGSTKTNTETFLPLVGGIFVKGKLEDNKKVLINVGQGVIVERTTEEAREMVRIQEREIKKVVKQLEDGLYNLTARSQEIQQELTSARKE